MIEQEKVRHCLRLTRRRFLSLDHPKLRDNRRIIFRSYSRGVRNPRKTDTPHEQKKIESSTNNTLASILLAKQRFKEEKNTRMANRQ